MKTDYSIYQYHYLSQTLGTFLQLRPTRGAVLSGQFDCNDVCHQLSSFLMMLHKTEWDNATHDVHHTSYAFLYVRVWPQLFSGWIQCYPADK